ncbi:hypothetical protein B0H13DRAFT_2557117 [Mycena leptocephala]|nr:hypothetical protein B0H13DRAFT_2557117 [Mycena leptocephala]
MGESGQYPPNFNNRCAVDIHAWSEVGAKAQCGGQKDMSTATPPAVRDAAISLPSTTPLAPIKKQDQSRNVCVAVDDRTTHPQSPRVSSYAAPGTRTTSHIDQSPALRKNTSSMISPSSRGNDADALRQVVLFMQTVLVSSFARARRGRGLAQEMTERRNRLQTRVRQATSRCALSSTARLTLIEKKIQKERARLQFKLHRSHSAPSLPRMRSSGLNLREEEDELRRAMVVGRRQATQATFFFFLWFCCGLIRDYVN